MNTFCRILVGLNENIKKRIMTFGLILVAGFFTSFIDSFSYPAIILIVPGILFGLAITIPHFDRSRKQIIALLTFPVLMILSWIFIAGIGLGLGIINNSYSDKTGPVILGVSSSVFFLIILEQYYPIENKKISILVLIVLGIISTLICDFLFLTPHSKELNIGNMITIWEIMIGLGLTFIVKFKWTNNNKEIEENTPHNPDS
jgi:hypothetical protein